MSQKCYPDELQKVLKMKWKIGLQHHTFVAACGMEIGIDTDCTGRKQSFYH